MQIPMKNTTKSIVPFVQRTLTLGDEKVSDPRNPDFMRASGSVVGPKALAERRGLVLKDMSKDDRKALMRELDEANAANAKFGRIALTLALTDNRLGTKRVKFVTNKAGEFVGVDASLRINAKAAAADLGAQLKAAKLEIEQLKAEKAQAQLSLE